MIFFLRKTVIYFTLFIYSIAWCTQNKRDWYAHPDATQECVRCIETKNSYIGYVKDYEENLFLVKQKKTGSMPVRICHIVREIIGSYIASIIGVLCS